MESWLFLGTILVIAVIAKNKALMIGVAAVMVLKLIPMLQPWLLKLGSSGD